MAATPPCKSAPRPGRPLRGAAPAALVAAGLLLASCGGPAATPASTGTSRPSTSTTASTTTSTTGTTTTTSTTTVPVTTTTTTTTTSTTTVPVTTTTTTTTTSTTTAPVTTTTACAGAVDLANWSLQRLAEQTIVLPVDEGDVAAAGPGVASGAGGVILFGTDAPSDLGSRLDSLDALAPGGIAPFVMADEEGGAVQRLANLVGSVPSAREMGATMTPAQIRTLAATLGQRMRAAGVTMDLAPVLDVDGGAGPNNQDPDGTRSFSDDEKTASADGLAFEAGLLAGGVIPVVKHFPGLGGATGNTDVMSASTPPWATLRKLGLVPFENAVAAGAPAVMVANASVPGLTSLPASISPTVITGLLRGRLGFQGLIMTDSLSAVSLSAIGYSVPAATVAALEAGADMVLFNASSSQLSSVSQQIVSAVVAAVASGGLSRTGLEEAVAHILSLKHVTLCPIG